MDCGGRAGDGSQLCTLHWQQASPGKNHHQQLQPRLFCFERWPAMQNLGIFHHLFLENQQHFQWVSQEIPIHPFACPGSSGETHGQTRKDVEVKESPKVWGTNAFKPRDYKLNSFVIRAISGFNSTVAMEFPWGKKCSWRNQTQVRPRIKRNAKQITRICKNYLNLPANTKCGGVMPVPSVDRHL